MDTESVNLARQTLRVYAEGVGPVYEGFQDALTGRLATNGLALEELRAQEAIRRNNYALISGLVHNLPLAEAPAQYRGLHFLLDDAYQARQVEANVLWVGCVRGAHTAESRTSTAGAIARLTPAQP